MPKDELVISQDQGITVASFGEESILDDRLIDRITAALYEIVDERACRKLIVDFTVVSFLASQMLGVIIALNNKIVAIDGKLVLCGISPHLMKVFQIMRMDKQLTIAADISKAMSEFETTAG